MGTVKLKESQWRRVREVVREREARGPRVNPAELSPKNKQYVQVTTSEADENGLYDGVWYQTDHIERDIVEKNEIKVLPVGGFEPSQDAFYEGTQTGTSDSIPVFSIVSGGFFPGIISPVTNVCPIGAVQPVTITATSDYEISSEEGQAVIAGFYKAAKGPVKIKASITWKDPDYSSSTGDSFGFYLLVNDTDYTGAPIYIVTFLGDAATVTREMEWEIDFAEEGDYTVSIWAYRDSGSQPLTVDTSSRVEIGGSQGGLRVEYTPMAFDFVKGRKVCIDNPKNCCNDDQSSDTSSNDQSSRSPFPLLWSNGYEPTCPGIMNWQGLAVHGPINTDPRAVALRYKMTLPTFEPYEITAADWVSDPPSTVLYPACDAQICSLLSGRQVILQAEFDGTNATYLNPGTCAYSATESHNLSPSHSYLLPNGFPLEVLWQLNLSFRFSWKAIEYFYNGSGVMEFPPMKRLGALVSGTNWWGQGILGASRFYDTSTFYFDTPITLGGTMNPSAPIPSSTSTYSILLVPRKPQDIYEDPAFPSGNAVRFAGIKVTGNFVLDPY